MGELFSKYKMYLFVVAGVLIAIGAWWTLSGGTAPDSLLATKSASDASPVEKDLIDTLLQLRSVSLSSGIFSDPAFMGLRDFGTQIIPEPVGRPNPFAPLSAHATSTPRGSTLFEPRRP